MLRARIKFQVVDCAGQFPKPDCLSKSPESVCMFLQLFCRSEMGSGIYMYIYIYSFIV